MNNYTDKQKRMIHEERYNLLYWLSQDNAFTDDYIANKLLIHYERRQEGFKKLISRVTIRSQRGRGSLGRKAPHKSLLKSMETRSV